MSTPKVNQSGAAFSDCWKYRYRLWRYWNHDLRPVLFVMLNPSTADAEVNDATIRKCLGFAQRMNCGGIEVVNLFAWRATKPADLRRAFTNPVGPKNDEHIRAAARSVYFREGFAVCAWGVNTVKYHDTRALEVRKLLLDIGVPTYALQINNDGTPAHPLMLPYALADDLLDYTIPDDVLYGDLA